MSFDQDVLAFVVDHGGRIADEFAVPFDDQSIPLLEWSDHAEYRPATADGRPRIFVIREGSDWWRLRYQIAHEVFHWICTPPGIFHWVHEMFAVETAVRAMESLGETEYVRRETERLAADASSLRRWTMLTTPLTWQYPPGLYGQAWSTGRELVGAIGWEALKPLARTFDGAGRPDVHRWLRTLAPDDQKLVERVLGQASPRWV